MGEDDIVLTVRARHFSRHPGSRRAVGPSSPSAPRDSLQFTCAEHKYPPHRTQFGGGAARGRHGGGPVM
eukprot:4677368-Pyramimonas_sp.AAC.1